MTSRYCMRTWAFFGMYWQIADTSVDLFLTDPPYGADAIPLYERLAELAAAKLKPERFCFAYTGQHYLPDVLSALSKHLEYWWQFAIRISSKHCQIWDRKVHSKWRSVVAFGKAPKPPDEWMSDLLEGGGREKDTHDWQQAECEFAYLIRKLTLPGDLIVDPFCGAGTVPAACKRMNRRWVATELDAATAVAARYRVSSVAMSHDPGLSGGNHSPAGCDTKPRH